MAKMDSGIPTITTPTMNTTAGSVGGGGGGTSNKDLMAEARASLSGNWGWGILGYIIYTAFSLAITIFVMAAAFFVGMVSGIGGGDVEAASNVMGLVSQSVQWIIAGPLMVGFYGFYLGIAQEDEGRLELLFVGFQRFWKSFGAYFFFMLFYLLWFMLFIIPGIIALFRYAMAFFIIADDEDCGPLEAITRSKLMMKGNKWKYFCLNCRFIGWSLLAFFFTFGIGFLWLVPYMQTAQAKFYEDIK